ncbi:DUF945 family protein [Oxalobacteraceae bacterium A2-2]
MFLKKSIYPWAAALALVSAHAAQPKPAEISSEMMLTAMAAAKEISKAQLDQQNKAKALEKLSKFEYSAELRPRLKQVFGSERPMVPERVAAAKGRISYVARLLPHTYTEADGQQLSWTTLTARASTDRGGRSLVVDLDLPSFDVRQGDEAIHVKDIRASARQRLGYQGLWFGVTDIRVGSLAIDGELTATADLNVQGKQEVKRTASLGPLRMEGMGVSAEMKQRGKLVDMVSRVGIARLQVAGEHVEQIHLDSSVIGLDAAALARYQKEMAAVQARTDLAPEQSTAEVVKQLKALARSMVERGASIRLDKLGASYHGQAFTVTGSVAFDRAVASDLDDPIRLARKMVAKVDIRVPLALVREVALTVARKQGGDESQVQLAAKQMTDVVVGKLVGGGFATLQDDELRSQVEVNHGRLTFNGKQVELPNLASDDIFGERTGAAEIPGQCQWPPEPPVTSPTELVLSYEIDKEGRARKVTIVKPSGLPDFDAATAAAANACRWTPARQGRTPMASTVMRTVTLTPPGEQQPAVPVPPQPASAPPAAPEPAPARQ